MKAVDFSRLRRWGIKGGFAVLDQGLFSGSNFLLNILLARWLTPAQYGAFAIGYAIYIFLSVLHNALILEPLSVFGTSRYVSQLKPFLASQFASHFLVTGILGLLVVLASYALFALDLINTDIFHAIMGVGLSLPFLLFIWVARRIYYVLQVPKGSLQTTLQYSVVMAVLVYLLFSSPQRENIALWFAIMGLASFVSSLNIIFQIWSEVVQENVKFNWTTFFHAQWTFGRWIVLASLLYSTGTQIQLFVTASFLGLQAAGVFRAVQNFMLPMFQILAPVSTLALPSIAYEFGLRNYSAIKRKSWQVTYFLVGLASLYELLLLFFGADLERLLYGGKYSDYVWLMPWVGLVPLINAVETGFSLTLRSLQKPEFYIIDKAIAAFIGGLTAFVFIAYWKVPGAVASLIIIEFITLVVYWWLCRRWFMKLIGMERL